MAIARLGPPLVCNLVTSLILKQLHPVKMKEVKSMLAA